MRNEGNASETPSSPTTGQPSAPSAATSSPASASHDEEQATELAELKADLRAVRARVMTITGNITNLDQKIKRIRGEVQAGYEEFRAATGKSRNDYHLWRRKARGALESREKARAKAQRELETAMDEMFNLSALITIAESEYRGADPMRLLAALYHLTLRLWPDEEHPSRDDIALLGAVKLQIGGSDGSRLG